MCLTFVVDVAATAG